MPYTHKPFPYQTAGARRIVIEETETADPHLETCLSVGIRRQNYLIYDELLPVIRTQLADIKTQLAEILEWLPEAGRRPKWWTNTDDALHIIGQALDDLNEIERSRKPNRWLVVEYLTGEILAAVRAVNELMQEVDVEAPPDNPDRRRTPSKEIIIKQFEGLINQGRRNN